MFGCYFQPTPHGGQKGREELTEIPLPGRRAGQRSLTRESESGLVPEVIHNHGLYRFNQITESEGPVKQRVTKIRDESPELKTWSTDLNDVYSKVLQTHAERITRNITNLGKLKAKGCNAGSLNWKNPREYWSVT